ncbi:TIGR02391 family protein [Clostridioides difficile]|uniref:TIGR02391 family protein n=2 Tax=Clostridioides difficile TaxID=1496 RepID=UPI00038CD00D|nr:TIGR02391 family protein [Clostridioides difficile]EGT4637067.1 TIGR02391 family protein [Clostridioides difficile]EQJ83997.1 hypothetical protein QU9_1955 [Clostridioides difficile P48]MBH8106275.1 TIGR02391 family protein [Clostridioides difficile]MBJ9796288.1 TIGR02391 family protein [Clostridioides difficile]MCA0606684.1 TIGR02391 family protein [Clostridioides difficile]
MSIISTNTKLIPKFSESDCKEICSIIKDYCTGSEISRFLNDLNFYNIQKNSIINYSKTQILLSSVMEEQKRYNDGSPLLKLVQVIFNPMRFINNNDYDWKTAIVELNTKFQFFGLMLDDSGKIKSCIKTNTYNEAEKRYKSLKNKLLSNNIHPEVLKCCKAEYLDKNYFHCILEASKGIFCKLRSLSTLDLDGNKLINNVFNENYPIIIFNTLQTEEEKNEYLGFKYLLKSITCLFRNPKAHNLKIYSYTSEEDAFMVLNILSYAFKQLDKCSLNTYALKQYKNRNC